MDELEQVSSTLVSSRATPPLSPPPLSPETDRLPAPCSPSHSPVLRHAVEAIAPPVPPTAHTMPGAGRVVSFHHPTLCVEAFFTLQWIGGQKGEECEAASMGAAKSPLHKSDSTNFMANTTINTCDADSHVLIYTSEVVRGSSHPSWSAIPASALQACAHGTCIELSVFYTGTFISKACSLQNEARERGLPHAAMNDAAAPLSGSTSSEDNDGAAAHVPSSPSPSDVCVHRCRADVRHTFYLGATVEEADVALSRLLRLEEQRTQGPRCLPRPLVYLHCSDGIFAPQACFADWRAPVADTVAEWQAARTRTFCPAPTASDFHVPSPSPSSLNAIAGRNSLAAVAAAQAAAACSELPWSRAPSAVGWRYPAFAVPRAGQLRVTLGDVKAAAHATLAWERLAHATEQRKRVLASQLDTAAVAHPTARAVMAQCAALRVQLSAAREALTLSTLELESLRDGVERRQRHLQREEEAFAAVQNYEKAVDTLETGQAQREQVREEEAQRAQLRAQLARGRQQRVRELGLMYAVTLSSQYASYACAVAADAKDYINNAGLPIVFADGADVDIAWHLVASSEEDMHEEAVALGHACHVLLVLSVLYSCTLPYPILLGGGQSHVLTSPSIDAAQARAAPYTLTDACKYPLSCRRAAERPLMMAGAHLLLRNGVVLADTMGKPERRIAACANRLGALLYLLLSDME